MAKSTKKAATFNPATNPADNELAVLAQQLLASKAAKPEPITLDKAHHVLVVNVGKAEATYNKAEGGRWAASKALVETCMGELKSLPYRTALYHDIKTTLETMPAVSTQLVTVLNAVAYIVHGRPATRDTPAMAAQGEQPVKDALAACTSLKTFKSALTKLKPVQHASAGVAKVTASGEKAKQASGKAPTASDKGASVDEVHPSIAQAVKVLQWVASHDLKPGSDAQLIGDIERICAELQKRAA